VIIAFIREGIVTLFEKSKIAQSVALYFAD